MRTRRLTPRLHPALLAAALALPVTVTAQQHAPSPVEIAYEKFVLPNGLTLIVHEDRKAPIVAVNVWYHVGSKNEKPGKTGFAHLFEHLMFNGSEHYNDDYFKVLDRIGATDLNGTTNSDRTNYFQNVPTSAVDVALWMESDRMGHLLGAIDQARLDEQRGVVQNEKRQGENQPYGKADELISEGTYPEGHPYSWRTIGYMEDLEAASLDDVKEWFRTYYGAANAVIVIAGDIDAQTAKQKVERHFGDIPSGPPVAKQKAWVAKMTGSKRATMQDRVPQARIYKVWNVPEYTAADADHLDLVTDVLASGKTSRLYKRLVYDDQIATNVNAYIWQRELGSQLYIVATARPGQDLAAVEQAIDEELARFLAEGPTAAELQRVKTNFRANFIKGIERIGGFGGKSDILAMSQVYGGSPDYYKVRLDRAANATAADLQGAARRWLSDGVYVLEVHPFPEYQVATAGVDRSKVPEPGAPPAVKFATVERATLSNGLDIVLAKRDAVPVVNVQLLVDAGYAADQFAAPGTASLAVNMMDEGTKTRSALEISEQLANLGASLTTGSMLDASMVNLVSLSEHLDRSLEIFADVVLNPAFPQDDFERLRKQQLAAIQREKVTPVQMALRVFPALLYGDEHAYGVPLTGSGTEAAVHAMTRADLQKFHATWFKPNNATLIVVGNTTMAELRPKLERLFRGWKAGAVPTKNIGTVAQQPTSTVYLIDRPGSQQSIIFAGNLIAPRANPDEIALQTLNTILGGEFSARINMNLREDKHWSYGAFSLIWDARGQRPFIAYAPVQTDKTKESVAEVAKELREILTTRPPTDAELVRAKDQQVLTLPGRWETNAAVLSSLQEIENFGLPPDYFDTYGGRVRALTTKDVVGAASKVVRPSGMVWVVVGDRAKIEAGIRELGLGEIKVINADGQPAEQEKAAQE